MQFCQLYIASLVAPQMEEPLPITFELQLETPYKMKVNVITNIAIDVNN